MNKGAHHEQTVFYPERGAYTMGIKIINKFILLLITVFILSVANLAFAELGDHQKAIKDFDKAIELNPKDADAYSNRGFTYGKLGDSGKAIRDLKTAARLGHKAAQDFLQSKGISCDQRLYYF
jgi:tetratricopeptide (TPR) repeat protein